MCALMWYFFSTFTVKNKNLICRITAWLMKPIPQTAAVAMLLGFSVGSSAQGFDPAKVDWAKLSKITMQDGFIRQFSLQCGACHGEDLRGTSLGKPLVGVDLSHGATVQEIAVSIARGLPDKGMPAWGETLNETQIWNLALYVAEQRQGTTILDKRSGMALTIPTGRMASERESFRVETVAEGLDPMPFSIALLPDWRILLSERMRGLSIIGRHTDRCSDCNDLSRRSKRPVSMNRLVRGRIRGMAWVDQEILWQADPETYTDTSDLAAGGRIAFDDSGHVYFSVGMKAPLDYMGIQDLTLPHGKIHRLEDDGRIPPDNLFVKTTAALKSIWTCGHRSVQGLEFNTQTRDLWSTEMGPRGGDEVNRLLPGGNYGWPVFTNGVNYDGRPVNGARLLNSNLESKDTLFPVLDMTPSQGISSFVFYRGKEFRNWQNNIIVGTLRATDLLRMEVVENQVMRTEILLKDLARFRDIALGPEGEIYLLLENAGGLRIVRLVAD